MFTQLCLTYNVLHGIFSIKLMGPAIWILVGEQKGTERERANSFLKKSDNLGSYSMYSRAFNNYFLIDALLKEHPQEIFEEEKTIINACSENWPTVLL